MKPRLVLALLLSFAGAAGAARPAKRPASSPPPPFHVRVQAAPDTLEVGDRTLVTVTFAAPAAIRFVPAVSATLADDWELLGMAGRPARPLPDGTVETTFLLTLVPWSATVTGTPPLSFNAIAGDGVPHALTVAPAAVTMHSVLAGAKESDGLKPPKGMIVPRSWWPWILGGLALAAVLAGWWLWSRRRAAAQAGPAGPVRPAEEDAREALAALLASDLLDRGEVKRFYSELSDIFRRYLEGRFRISALDRTTAELLPELRNHPALKPMASDIRVFFEDCDLVKFARYTPPREDIEADVTRGRRLVDETAPRRPALPAAPPGGPA